MILHRSALPLVIACFFAITTSVFAIQIGTNDSRISTMGPDGNDDYDATDPRAVYNSTANEYVVVWDSDDNTGSLVAGEDEIYAQRINAATGALIGSRVRVSTTGTDGDNTRDATNPAIAWDSTNNQYLVVWQSDVVLDNKVEVYGQILSSTLADVSGEFRISTTGSDANENQDGSQPQVVFNPTAGEFFAIWIGNAASIFETEIESRRISTTGTLLGSQTTLTDVGTPGSNLFGVFAVALAYNATDNEYLALGVGDFEIDGENEVWGQRVTAAGAATGTNDFRITNLGPDGNDDYAASTVGVAWNSDNNTYLVVLTGDHNASPVVEGETEVWAQLLTNTGVKSGSLTRVSIMGDDSETDPLVREDYDASEAQVAYNPGAGEFFVTWHSDNQFSFLTNGENEVYGQRLNGTTLAAVGPNIRLTDAGPDRTINFTADGARVTSGPSGEWAVFYEAEEDVGSLVDNETEIYLQRYSNTGTNNPPQEVLLSTLEFEDDVGVGDLVAEIGAIDGDTTDSFTFSLVSGTGDTDNGSFSVSGDSLLGATTFDANTKSSYSIRLQLSDGTSSVQGSFTLTVVTANNTRIGDMFRLSTYAPDGDDSYDSNNPATAYNPDDDEFIVVWYGESSDATYGLGVGESEAFAARVDAASRAIIGSPVRISDSQGLGNTNASFTQIDVAYDTTNDQYLVVWITDDTGTDNESEVFGQFLNTSLSEVGTNDFRITNIGPNGVTGQGASEARVIYNPTSDEFLVVVEGDDATDNVNEVYAQRITASTRALTGSLTQISNVGANDADDPYVAWNSTNNTYLFVWDGDPVSGKVEIYGEFRSATLGLLGSSDFQISTSNSVGNTSIDADAAWVAYNSTDDEFLVVWDADSDTGGLVDNESEIYGRRIDGTTRALLGSQTRYSDAGGTGDGTYDALDPQVAYSPAKNEYVILWDATDNEGSQVSGETELFVQRVNANTGAEINGDERITFVGPDGNANYDANNGWIAHDHERHQFLAVFRADDDSGSLLDNENEIWGQFWRFPPPDVSSITRLDTNPAASTTVRWTVTFSEAVAGINTGDFSLSKTGSADGSISSVSAASGTSVTVTATGLTGSGTIALRLVDDDSITASSTGFKLGGDGTGNGSSLGEAYTVVNTNSTPTDISLSSSSIGQSTTGTNATVGTLSTTDADSGDSHTYSLVSGTGDTNNGSFNISGTTLRTSGALTPGTYNIRVNTNDGTDDFAKQLSVTITDDVAPSAPSTPDLDSSSDSGASSTDNITNDTTPTFEGTAEAGSTVTIFVDVNTNGTFENGTDTVVAIGTATGGNYSLTPFSAQAEGTLTVRAVAADSNSNLSTGSAAFTVTIDTTAPVITSAGTTSGVYGSSPSYTVSASGSPTSFGATGLTTGLSVNSTTGIMSGSAGAIGSANATITATDAAGNTGNTSLTVTITAKPLTITGLTGSNKTYDGNTAGSATGSAALTGIVGADDVFLSGSPVFTFASANVGTGITLNTTGYTLSGTAAGNYTLTQPTLSADITAAPLTLTGLTGADKVYDGNTAGAATGTASLSGTIGADDVSLSGTPVFTFASANVGTGVTLNTTGYTLSGTAAGNYALTQPTLAADITAKAITITGLTGASKPYDGTTAGSATGTASLSGTIGGDDVSLGGSPVFTFASANIGTGITVSTTGYTLSGTDSGNYTLTQPTLSADITAAELTITGLTGSSKTYDGNTAGSATGAATLTGIVGSDDVSLSGSPVFTFASANVGTGITLNTTGYTLSGTAAGNYTLTQPTLSADITAAPLTLTGLTGANKVYDGSTTGAATGTASLSGIIGGDDVSLSGTPVFTFASANVGTGITVNTTGYTLSGTAAGNYTLTQPTLSGDITAKGLTITGLTGSTKAYDGNTAGSTNGTASLAGTIGGDDVSLGGTPVFTFASANVGTGITVSTTGYTLSGTDSGNYTLTQPTLSADITAAPLTLTGLTGNSKTYDGNTAGSATGSASLTGVVGADDVSLSGSPVFTFASANVGTGITLNTTGYTLSGTAAGNYALTQPTLAADITAKAITVAGVTANNRVYDATTDATLATGSASLVGTIGGDTVALDATGASASFTTKDVGTAKIVTASGLGLSGADASNYTLTQPTGLTADITPAALTITGATASNKVYDATTAATLGGTPTPVGVLLSDTVTIDASSAAATFADKNVGTGKAVTPTGYALAGADATNYTVSQPTGLSADITPAALTLSGATADNKVYDATTTATLSGTPVPTGVLLSDVVTIDDSTAAGTFADKNVGTSKPVTATGYALAGADAGNYTVSQPTGLSADITPATLTIADAAAPDKVYDTTNTATPDLAAASLTGIQGSDTVSIDDAAVTATFADALIGTDKTVTFTGIALAGADAGNYTLTQPTALADITALELTITGLTAANKVYDTNTTATIDTTGTTLVGVLGGEDVTLDATGATGTFDDKNVGTAKTVTAAGFTLTGADTGNYTLTQPTTTADITVATVTVTGITAAGKTYDDTTDAVIDTGSATLNDVIGADDVALDVSSAVGAFADQTVGTDKTVTITGLALTGTDAGNYTITNPTDLADITAKTITVIDAMALDKVYDDNTGANLDLSSASLVGVETGDDVTLEISSAIGTFANANVGTGKTVALAGLVLTGADAGNYTLTQPTATASITARGVTVSGLAAVNKVYDATTTTTLDESSVVLNGVQGDDSLTLDTSAATVVFADPNVGTGKTVTVTGSVLAGATAGNYTLTQPSGLSADITLAELTLTGAAVTSKVYDATTTAPLDFSAATFVGVQGSDSLTLDSSAAAGTYADAGIGTAKPVTYSGLSFTGTGAANYDFTAPTLTGDITPAVITVSANNVARPFGDPNPTLVATYTGFVGGEDQSVISGEPVLTTDALRTSPIGTGYIITVQVGTLAAANYTFTSVDAAFEVQPGFHFADTDRDNTISLSELLRFIELYNHREGTRRTGAYQSDDTTVDRYKPGDGPRLLPHTADSDDSGTISLLELTRMIQLYNARSGTTRTGAYVYDPSTEDGFAPVLTVAP